MYTKNRLWIMIKTDKIILTIKKYVNTTFTDESVVCNTFVLNLEGFLLIFSFAYYVVFTCTIYHLIKGSKGSIVQRAHILQNMFSGNVMPNSDTKQRQYRWGGTILDIGLCVFLQSCRKEKIGLKVKLFLIINQSHVIDSNFLFEVHKHIW